MEEVWKDIPGHEGFYQASTFGRIRSMNHVYIRKNGVKRSHKGRIIKTHHYPNGYQFACLVKNGKHIQISVHRLILITFKGEKKGYEVNHIDEDKDNNHLDNLEWVTHKYNCRYGTRNIRCKEHSDFSGERNPMFGRKGCLNPRSIKVYAISQRGEKTFSSIKEAADFFGMNAGYVGRIAGGRYKKNIFRGYKLYTENNYPFNK